ncbi:MAG TPA: VOC family protein [Chitinophagaceae bacterium]|nr:VOC family protein [Chitinophagaceae bacterium]
MQAKLNNITLPVKSPQQIRDFYVNVFGLKELEYTSRTPGFFMLDGNGCTLTIQDAEAIGQSTGSAGVELGFEVDDVPSFVPRIMNYGGVILSENQQMGWGQAFTAADPEGHVMNIFKFHQ